jgi:hypothetical protein
MTVERLRLSSFHQQRHRQRAEASEGDHRAFIACDILNPPVAAIGGTSVSCWSSLAGKVKAKK